MIHRCKKEGEQFSFHLPSKAIKTVKFQSKSNESAHIFTSRSVMIGGGDPAAFHTRKYLGERIIATPRNRLSCPVMPIGELCLKR